MLEVVVELLVGLLDMLKLSFGYLKELVIFRLLTFFFFILFFFFFFEVLMFIFYFFIFFK